MKWNKILSHQYINTCSDYKIPLKFCIILRYMYL